MMSNTSLWKLITLKSKCFRKSLNLFLWENYQAQWRESDCVLAKIFSSFFFTGMSDWFLNQSSIELQQAEFYKEYKYLPVVSKIAFGYWHSGIHS